ncbi:MAG: hypothetical protein ABIP10_06020, partial [Ferruginibacter sp.]
HASLLAEVVHCYLPKWCTLIYRSGALLFTDFGALLFTDHTFGIDNRNTGFAILVKTATKIIFAE